MSDTVGFIKKLPHDLVASFRSTLDEAMDASLLLYIVDASDPSFRSQLETTKSVLSDIGAADVASMLVLNKTDKLSELEKAVLKREYPEGVFLSALNPESVRNLRNVCVEYFERFMIDKTLFIPYGKQSAAAEIHKSMRVIDEKHDENGTTIKFKGFAPDIERIVKQYKLA